MAEPVASAGGSWSVGSTCIFMERTFIYGQVLQILDDHRTLVSITVTLAFICCFHLVSHSFLYLKSKMTTPAEPTRPFRFLDLPRELRDMVYEGLLPEDPHYPPPQSTSPKQTSLSFLRSLVPYRSSAQTEKRQSTWILLANHQTYAEFMDLLVRSRTFYFEVSPASYPHPQLSAPLPPSRLSPATITPTTPTTTTSSSSQNSNTARQNPLWTISPTTLSALRHCTLKLTTTSSMLGVSDPRAMTPGTWALAHLIRTELSPVQNVKELDLHVKAVGDPLWNPLWVWFHAALSFIPLPATPNTPNQERAGCEGDAQVTGPNLSKILFSLDTWSPGENHLAKDKEGEWEWYCAEGHAVGAEADTDMTVREFCARLYKECRVCRPEMEVEEGGD